jgi:hypothetical protein
MIESIYKGMWQETFAVDQESLKPLIVQHERLTDGTCLKVAYTLAGKYIGSDEDAKQLLERGITEQLQPAGDGNVCSVGFNPSEQQWYGWSHRAIYGFGIGSKVNKGDCGYQPVDVEDLNRDMLDFWDVDNGVWRECESPEITCTTHLVSLESNVYDTNGEDSYDTGKLGTMLRTKTEFRGADRNYESRHFQAYPDVWGRGAWVAETLDDARQMAIDFANGVS